MSNVTIKNELSLTELREIQLQLLKFIKDLCEKHELRYFLCGGTLLGAIRHKGYIPWDDDIDIFMPRPDYMKLIALLKEESSFVVKSMYHDADYCGLFTKLCDKNTYLVPKDPERVYEYGHGVFIDILPIDGLPKDSKKIKYHLMKLHRAQLLLYYSCENKVPSSSNKIKEIFKKHIWKYARARGCKRWRNRAERLLNKYSYNESEKCGGIVGQYGFREVMDKGVFQKEKMVEFENSMYPAPIGYHEYLTSLYGDYMELPPENKRVTHHLFRAIWKS